ncbi:hypothetical protein MIMGU_mgv1a025849mg, partial [Erythranthe guttata]
MIRVLLQVMNYCKLLNAKLISTQFGQYYSNVMFVLSNENEVIGGRHWKVCVLAPPESDWHSFYHLITHNLILANNYFQLDYLKQAFQLIKYLLIDENTKFYNSDPCSNIILHLNWYFSHLHYCQERSTIMSLGQFICENICIAKNAAHLKLGQVILVKVDSVVIRSAKPYLATPGATVHGYYGEILYEGDTVITFIYEKSRSEHVLEVRSIDSISMNLEKRVE